MSSDNLELLALRERNRELLLRTERYEQQLRRMAIISEIAEAANETSDPHKAIEYTLMRICHDTSWPVGHAFIVHRNNENIWLASYKTWYLAEESRFTPFVDFTEKLELKPGQGLPGVVFRDQEALWANAMKSDARRFAIARKVGLQSTFGFPVMIGNEVIAILELFSERNVAPDEVVLDIVAQLGMLLGRVFERHRANNEQEALNEKLVITSRRAGMAEIASGVLHNVGNVLNSIAVSSTLLQEELKNTSIGKIAKVAELLNENRDNLADFLSNDDKGKKIISYLDELAHQLGMEHAAFDKELSSVLSNVNHIKNAIRRQQFYAKPTVIKERVCINNLVEDALKMNNLHTSGHRIRVDRNYSELPEILLDKHDVIQILNNLIGNAKQALDQTENDPLIYISTKPVESNRFVELQIRDNGCGIPTEIQDNIFQFGFTTKTSGHGFGLHTCANTAQAMGGKLSFFSQGRNQGTTFTLILPFETGDTDKGEIAA